MKLKNLKTPTSRKRGNTVAVALSLCLLFCASLVQVGAQRAQKRITSVWTATGAEGSRVTVASDAQLSDYEAYTRGDRFYVKIPLADLPSTTGSLLGRGFDDVQIQRVGDGILLSFRMQPGTTARVFQKTNRLEIAFSIPMRSPSSASSVARNEVANRTRARTIRDTVGPAPPTSVRENQTGVRSSGRHAERGARTTESVRSSNSRPAGESHPSSAKSRASESARQKESREKAVTSSLPKASSTASTKPPRSSESPRAVGASANKGSTAKGSVSSPSPAASPAASPVPSPSPIYSPTPVPSPSSALAAASPSGTPLAGPFAQQGSPSASPTPASSSAGTTDWSSRLHYYEEWARLNPIPLVIAGIVFVALLLLLFVRGGGKRRHGDPANREEKRAVPATVPNAPSTVKTSPKPDVSYPAVAGADQNRGRVSSPNSISSPAAPNHAGEDPDREVFEL